MSKRYFPQQYGDRKKAKLDVTISDHNFPLSQNAAPKESNQDTWGDDNDDEILLLASQACESAYDDIGSLPDYSMCMQPPSTSTQINDPGPSTSKTAFTFKKPTGLPPSSISTNLKDKCSRISSPLPGIASKIVPQVNNNNGNISDDLIFNDKIYKNQDSDHVYRQLLQLQEENTKLKSENGKLLEKCVTKEGEASILRTQLKSCQRDVDNARMERIKAQEKAQMEWTEKLQAANSQMNDLRNQLDFKNLEIISIKEKCKLLESNKVKLTQVMVSHNDVSINHSNRNNSFLNNAPASHKRVKTVTSSAQTEDKAQFMKLNKSFKSEESPLHRYLPLVLEPSPEQHSLLEYNEKLHKHNDLSQIKCKIFSTFNRVPSTPLPKETSDKKVSLSCIHRDLTAISTGDFDKEHCFNVLRTVKRALHNVSAQLELISTRINSGFLRSADEQYIEAASQWLVINDADLISASDVIHICMCLDIVLYNYSFFVFASWLQLISTRIIQVSCNQKTMMMIIDDSDLISASDVIHICMCLDIVLYNYSFFVFASWLQLISTRIIQVSCNQKTMMMIIDDSDLISARCLYKEEQGIPVRRMVAILACALRSAKVLEMYKNFEEFSKNSIGDGVSSSFIELVLRICNLLDVTSCAVYYSSLLLSIIKLVDHLAESDPLKTTEILRSIISSRPMTFVCCGLLCVLRRVCLLEDAKTRLCPRNAAANLRMDYDQGVLLYKKDSCHLQILCKQVEVALKCIERENLANAATTVTRHLLALFSNLDGDTYFGRHDKSGCECQLVLMQVIVYALSICAAMMDSIGIDNSDNKDLLSVCRSGVQAVFGCALRDMEFSSRLGHLEGHLLHFTEIVKTLQHSEAYGNMLAELSSTFQTSSEEVTSSYHRQAWFSSFQDFSLID